MNALFSRLGLLAVLLALLLPTNASGQIQYKQGGVERTVPSGSSLGAQGNLGYIDWVNVSSYADSVTIRLEGGGTGTVDVGGRVTGNLTEQVQPIETKEHFIEYEGFDLWKGITGAFSGAIDTLGDEDVSLVSGLIKGGVKGLADGLNIKIPLFNKPPEQPTPMKMQADMHAHLTGTLGMDITLDGFSIVHHDGELTNASGGWIGAAGISGIGVAPNGLTRRGILTNNGRIDAALVRDYGRLTNTGEIYWADVSGVDSTVMNHGRIFDVTVGNHGYIQNFQNHTIGTAQIDFLDVYTGGLVQNRNGATIGLATLYGGLLENRNNSVIHGLLMGGGTVTNFDNAHIGTALLNIGTIHNHGTIDIVVSAGLLDNHSGGTINWMSMDGGTLNNLDGGTITEATVSGGRLENLGGGTIKEATIYCGGRLTNSGTIETANLGNSNIWWLDPAHLFNIGHIETANISRGRLQNWVTATIETATVSGGVLENVVSRIGTVTISGGLLENRDNSRIGAVTISGGRLENRDTSFIGMATIYGGQLENRGGDPHSIFAGIDTAILNGGTVWNLNNARIATVAVNGGILWNENSAHIETLTVDGGWLENWDNASNGSATVNSGTLNNRHNARIDAATVNGGRLVSVPARACSVFSLFCRCRHVGLRPCNTGASLLSRCQQSGSFCRRQRRFFPTIRHQVR